MPVSIRGAPTNQLGAFTVANLPTTTMVKTLGAGDMAFATNGRKDGEGAGVGTGVPVFWDGSGWKTVTTGAAVAA